MPMLCFVLVHHFFRKLVEFQRKKKVERVLKMQFCSERI